MTNNFLLKDEVRKPEYDNQLDFFLYDNLLALGATGEKREDRTGTGTRSRFGTSLKFDVPEGKLPVVTVKKIQLNSVIHELVWMIRGVTNVSYLNENGVHIWDAWADEYGDLGPVYGAQWRGKDGGPDQLARVVSEIAKNPNSRRLVVDSWNPSRTQEMNLPPCHYSFQFSVREGGKLDVLVNQRSQDLFLGAPFNWTQYSLLLSIVAELCGLEPRHVMFAVGDMHLYNNHEAAATEYVKLYGEDDTGHNYPDLSLDLPDLDAEDSKSVARFLDNFSADTIKVENYEHGPFVRAPISA